MAVIDRTSTVRDVRRLFASTGIRPTLANSLSKDDLRLLASAHLRSRCRFELFEMIAAHPGADDELMIYLLEISPEEGVASSVVTSPRASRTLLERLRESPYAGVREHARFGLLKKDLESRLDMASEAEVLKIYEENQGGSAEAITSRLILALHPTTPISVLERLARDADQMISERARRRL